MTLSYIKKAMKVFWIKSKKNAKMLDLLLNWKRTKQNLTFKKIKSFNYVMKIESSLKNWISHKRKEWKPTKHNHVVKLQRRSLGTILDLLFTFGNLLTICIANPSIGWICLMVNRIC